MSAIMRLSANTRTVTETLHAPNSPVSVLYTVCPNTGILKVLLSLSINGLSLDKLEHTIYRSCWLSEVQYLGSGIHVEFWAPLASYCTVWFVFYNIDVFR